MGNISIYGWVMIGILIVLVGLSINAHANITKERALKPSQPTTPTPPVNTSTTIGKFMQQLKTDNPSLSGSLTVNY